MKRNIVSLLSLFLVFLSVVFLSASCKKNSAVPANTPQQISANINGAAWTSNLPLLSVYSTGGGFFQLQGLYAVGADTTGMALTFNTPFILYSPISSDTAQVDVAYVNAATHTQYDGGYITGHSLLTISYWDSVHYSIAGTFSGVLYNISGGTDSLVITNGQFSTSYMLQ